MCRIWTAWGRRGICFQMWVTNMFVFMCCANKIKNMNSKLILCSRILVFVVTIFYWLVLIWPVFFFCFTLYREWLHYKSSWIVVSRWKVIFNFVRSCMFFCFSIRIMWNLNLFAIIVWDNNILGPPQSVRFVDHKCYYRQKIR